MNVALTRARHALYVFGHMDTLKVGQGDIGLHFPCMLKALFQQYNFDVSLERKYSIYLEAWIDFKNDQSKSKLFSDVLCV